jgi:MFS family permease
MKDIHDDLNTWRSSLHAVRPTLDNTQVNAARPVNQKSTEEQVIWTLRDYLTACALGLGAFLTQFDVTAMVVALPSIARELDFGVAGFAWVMDSYSLAFTGALLAAGALADRFGRRRILLIGNMLFMVASIACGLSWNAPSLWIARVVQGGGAAFLVTGAISLIAGAFARPAHRARVFGFMGVISGVAMALGPTLGGLISYSFGWRWIFFANVPVCLALAAAAPLLVAESRGPGARPFDLPAVALVTAALAVAIDAMLRARESLRLFAVELAASAALALLFGWQQRRKARPLLDASVFATPVMLGIGTLLLALSFGYWAMLVYLPLFLGAAFHWNAETAGLGLLAATLPMLVLPPMGARLLMRWGWLHLFAVALGAVAAGDLLLLLSAQSITESTRMACAIVGMTGIGVGAALAHPQLSGAVLALAPADQAGMASSVTVIARQAGFAVGIAALGAALGPTDSGAGFATPFALATVASAVGMVGALLLSPRRQRRGVA